MHTPPALQTTGTHMHKHTAIHPQLPTLHTATTIIIIIIIITTTTTIIKGILSSPPDLQLLPVEDGLDGRGLGGGGEQLLQQDEGWQGSFRGQVPHIWRGRHRLLCGET